MHHEQQNLSKHCEKVSFVKLFLENNNQTELITKAFSKHVQCLLQRVLSPFWKTIHFHHKSFRISGLGFGQSGLPEDMITTL
jgi:hypothetical protein